MPGGIIDLKFIGSSNIYLTNNPQITFFKNVYKKYSNFSMEYIELPFNTLNDLNSNNEIRNTCNIDRNADLVKDMYFLSKLKELHPSLHHFVSKSLHCNFHPRASATIFVYTLQTKS